MKRHLRLAIIGAAALAACSEVAMATSIPVTTTFGALPSATFGGSGIYNDAVLQSTMTFGANTMSPNTITVGLSATPRGVGPELANNGVNTFYADPGPGSSPTRSKWNMDFDISSSLGNFTGYTLTLLYGKQGGPTYSLNLLTAFPDSTGAPGSWQNSENLTFGQFSSMGFDLNATGIYDFTVQVQKGDFVGTSGTMHVNVGNAMAAPDGGYSAALLGFGFVGLMGLKKRLGLAASRSA